MFSVGAVQSDYKKVFVSIEKLVEVESEESSFGTSAWELENNSKRAVRL
jgi:hypothetical protein